VHGKIIAIYDIVNQVLILYGLVDHVQIDTPNRQNALRSYIDTVTSDDLQTFSVINKSNTVLNEENKKQIIELFHEMIVKDLDIIKQALMQDNWNEFAELIGLVDESIDQDDLLQSVFTAWGSKEQFKQYMIDMIKHMGQWSKYQKL
jgi:hypothetical protein